MADYGVTPDGFVIKPLDVILAEIDDALRANIDPGLDLDARSAQGQVDAIFAAAVAELWELGEAAYNAAYPDSANDASLDNVSSITGTKRSPTTKTTIAGVQVTLNPNKNLPAGSVASLGGQPNVRFLSDVEVPADPNGGVFPVDFAAEASGATTVVPLQLDTIAEPVSGWTGVSNPDAGVTGEATETDPELRTKRIDELEGGGSTNVNSIRANLLRDTTAAGASVFENDTDLVDANGLSPHSIRCILSGGDPNDIGQSIFDTKASGIATNGAQSVNVLDSQGVTHVIRYDSATVLSYFLTAVVDVDPLTFDTSTGVAEMQQNVADYVNSLGAGGNVTVDQVKCAMLNVVGTVTVPAFFHGFAAAPTQTTDLIVAEDEEAASDTVNLDITTAGT